MKKNTEIMKVVNNLVKLPELQQTMMEMSKEMMKVIASSGNVPSIGTETLTSPPPHRLESLRR